MVGREVTRVPWSELGPEFATDWGRANPKNPQPEHMEIVGMNGSGKTYFLCSVLQERMLVRNTPTIIIATKPADSTLQTLGWPVVRTRKEASQHRQLIFWPSTSSIGRERKAAKTRFRQRSTRVEQRARRSTMFGLWLANSLSASVQS